MRTTLAVPAETSSSPRARTGLALVGLVALLTAIVPAVASGQGVRCRGAAVTLMGTPGPDVLVGTAGRDVIFGGGGDDVIDGRGGDDIICGEHGVDHISGGPGDDVIVGGPGHDVLFGGPGDDFVSGEEGHDTVDGASGDDEVRGGPGNDLVRGGPGVDHVIGNAGADVLAGGDGPDVLFGGDGDDRLFGGEGLDRCAGGAGIDRANGCEIPTGTEWGDRPPAVLVPPPGTVALTFDDGPHPVNTPLVLDALAKAGVKATFFVMGSKADRYPEIVARIVREGHSVQNHSYNHTLLSGLSYAVVSSEITRGKDAVTRAAGYPPRCFRPPFGGVNDTVRSAAAAAGQAVIMWTVDPQDWRQQGRAAITAHVVQNSTSGSIILLHDATSSETAAAVPGIAAGLREKGLRFVTLCS